MPLSKLGRDEARLELLAGFNRSGTFGTVVGSELVKLMEFIRPFFIWPVMAVLSFVLHWQWPANHYVMIFLAGITVTFIYYVMFLSKVHRKKQGTLHSMLTVFLLGALLFMIDAVGWTSATKFAMIFGVPALCLSWSIRAGIARNDPASQYNLDKLLKAAMQEDATMQLDIPEVQSKRRILKRKSSKDIVEAPAANGDIAKRLTGSIHLPGSTAEDIEKVVGNIESAAGWPPGTLSISPNLQHRGKVDLVISDPRVLDGAIPFPGPSKPGASIAEPIRVGLYQDSTEATFIVPETQIQVMGQIGSGKSLGGAWSMMSDVITRNDVFVWGIDIRKGMQTLGPLEPALHRIATNEEDAMQILYDVNNLIKPRTDYLTSKGLGKWQEGCGLQYGVIWIEEVPEVIKTLGKNAQDLWIRSVNAVRSAGITFLWSLQRADFTQIPTITRGQAVKWCFGVADQHEAKFGLSATQAASGCKPEQWGQRKPGMSYLDAPTVPGDKVAMPMRVWYWGANDSIMREHAAKFPASEKPYDHITRDILDQGKRFVDKLPDVPAKRATTLLSDPSDDEHEGKQDMRTVLREWVEERKGQQFKVADWKPLLEEAGYTRNWGYAIMNEFEEEGLVVKHRDPKNDRITYEAK